MAGKQLQRLRKSPQIRKLLAETHLEASNFIMPVFIREDIKSPQAISGLPQVYQHNLESMITEIQNIVDHNILGIMLFGIPNTKDAKGSQAIDPNSITNQAIKIIKKQFPNLILFVDCCFCDYTDHGACFVHDQNGQENKKDTLKALEISAVNYAKSGADFIAPSGMVDGMIHHIRTTLDQNNCQNTGILSYAVKYASAFYGPFRNAVNCPSGVDRKHHQLSISQRNEALQEAQADIEEGCDMIMVKPAGTYTDIIRDLKNTTHLPIAAYHVSGEYSMIKLASEKKIVNEEDAFYEVFMSLKRAGAQFIISYYAKEIATYLKQNH
tara:strand:+ start:2169 stop:3143 length:975 start_codon:yes stop_codon:yes gene_type:complete